MDLDQLEAFVSVATLGGFTRASGKLHRTQPAISRRVQLLERSLGVELFARRGREVTLTPEGRALLPYAQGALAALRDGLCAISEAGGTSAGPPLEVALVGTLADVQLASVLRRFRDIRPDTLNLRTAASREVSALVLRGEADIGIRYFPDHHPDLETIAVGVERLTLVVAADHRLAECVAVDPLDLVDEHWLSFPFGADDPGSFGHLLERALLAVGISEPNLTIIDSLTPRNASPRPVTASRFCRRGVVRTSSREAASGNCGSGAWSRHSPSWPCGGGRRSAAPRWTSSCVSSRRRWGPRRRRWPNAMPGRRDPLRTSPDCLPRSAGVTFIDG